MEIYDVAIIGGGPAGLSAAVTCGARHKKTIIFDGGGFSPRLRKAHAVKNYLGFSELSGDEMMNKFLAHAQEYNPEIIADKVVFASRGGKNFTLGTASNFYTANSVILATGGVTGNLLLGEKEFLGRGVSYCGTCDGQFFKGKTVIVLAERNDFWEEVEFLAELCLKVIVLSKKNISLPRNLPNVELRIDVAVEICGTTQVSSVKSAQNTYVTDGVFIFREADPADALFTEIKLLDKAVAVNREMQTNIPGVFAAGDCTGQPWQISRAVGEGLVAALSAVKYLSEQKNK